VGGVPTLPLLMMLPLLLRLVMVGRGGVVLMGLVRLPAEPVRLAFTRTSEGPCGLAPTLPQSAFIGSGCCGEGGGG